MRELEAHSVFIPFESDYDKAGVQTCLLFSKLFVNLNGKDLESKKGGKSTEQFISGSIHRMVVCNVFDDGFVHSI